MVEGLGFRLGKPVGGSEEFADARRGGGFLEELREEWEACDWLLGDIALREERESDVDAGGERQGFGRSGRQPEAHHPGLIREHI